MTPDQLARDYADEILPNLWQEGRLPGVYTDHRNLTAAYFTTLKELQDLYDTGQLSQETIEYLDQSFREWRDHLIIPAAVRSRVQELLVLSAEAPRWPYVIGEHLTIEDCKMLYALERLCLKRYPLTEQSSTDGPLQSILHTLIQGPVNLQGRLLLNAVLNISEQLPHLCVEEIHRRARQAYDRVNNTPSDLPVLE